MATAIRQRVLVEAVAVAPQVPVLYVDRPCATGREPLSFASTPDLLARGAQAARRFLADAPVPVPGDMVGSPHDHGAAGGGSGLEPRFPRGHGRAGDLRRPEGGT